MLEIPQIAFKQLKKIMGTPITPMLNDEVDSITKSKDMFMDIKRMLTLKRLSGVG